MIARRAVRGGQYAAGSARRAVRGGQSPRGFSGVDYDVLELKHNLRELKHNLRDLSKVVSPETQPSWKTGKKPLGP